MRLAKAGRIGGATEVTLPGTRERGRSRRWREHGASMLEYVLIVGVIGLIGIVATLRFSDSLRSRWKSGAGQLETAKTNDQSSASDAVAHSEGGSGQAAPGSAAPEPTTNALAGPGGDKLHVGKFAFDLSTILWLGLGLLAVTVLIVVR